ncbi:hypothetical protein [Actinomadura verrucosospora]|uniref:Uncharacterized protein n=1 Tax=Actinomadura verrucosospora TaxID=46165 RepID=A0A7D3VSK3_ACTVE|nr:hypothetical protein [Actinomadura verrucosospora]QKG19754.1 hypothetical protein ACTIVE_1390 [Actinomadura verrucosospora]
MDAAQAISLVVDWIRSRGLDYPTEGLAADRFEAGWSVYAPVDVDESDPMAFLDMPVGRSVFLVGDSGRIEEVSSSVPPHQAQDRFTARERAAGPTGRGMDADEYMADFVRWLEQDGPPDDDGPDGIRIVGPQPHDPLAGDDVDVVAAEAAMLIEPIVQEIALLGPPAWEWLWAEFAFTVSAEIAHLRFSSYHRSVVVPVPESVSALVREQRGIVAMMPAGPWWRLLLTVTNQGETTVNYDYGDGPFPHDQLLAPEHYRNDLETYPRPSVPAWLARYIDGPAA